MSVTYRYLLCDLLTDQPLAVLPLKGVSFDRRISRTGSLSATMEASTPAMIQTAKMFHAYAGRCALYAFRNGAIWWGGIPWTVVPSQGARGPVSLSVSAATFDSYAHRRLLREDMTFNQVDSGVIIPELWRWVQDNFRGDIGVVANDQPTGTLHDRTYLAADQSYVGKLVEDLGDVIDGPEHTIDVYLDANNARTKVLRVANTLGVQTPQVVFQRSAREGGSVLQWASPADASAGGTTFQTRGDAPNGNVGEDVAPLLSQVVERTDLLEAGWPLLDVTEDRPGVIEQATLNGYAEALASQRGGAPVTNGYTVQVGDTGWNPNRVGEPVRIKLRDAWHTDTDMTVRPVGCQVTAAEKGTPETITLLFGDD